MNKAILVGRLTKDIELKTVGQGSTLASFTLAVDRRFKNAQGERETDFIRCVSWNKTAEFAEQYFKKGDKLGAVGEIETRNYDDDKGNRVYITQVKVEEVYFVESKQDQTGYNGSNRGESSSKRNYKSDNRSTDTRDANSRQSSSGDDYNLPFSL